MPTGNDAWWGAAMQKLTGRLRSTGWHSAEHPVSGISISDTNARHRFECYSPQ